LGWNNKVSSFLPLFIGGVDMGFDKAFFSKKLFTHWGWGTVPNSGIDFCGPLASLNDKASSWWNAGI